jgi:hypothetical protein
VVVGVVTAQPGASSGGGAARGVVDQTLAMLDGLADEGGRGSLAFLGRWKENWYDRAMPVKLRADRRKDTFTAKIDTAMVRKAFCKLVDELVQTNATSGTLAISCWTETKTEWVEGQDFSYEVTVWEFSWSASPDDTSYQRHGSVGTASKQQKKIRFADFEGAVDDFGDRNQMAVYRVTLPSRGLDPDKWVGRPPPPAPEDLYTGPRDDGLLSTEEISGDYSAACICHDGRCPMICNSMTVVPLGADVIETWRTGCIFFPPLIGPTAEGAARTRDPGTNTFGGMTFSAGGRAKQTCGCFKKRPTSQKRAFQKVDARDLAGNWRGCFWVPFVPFWPFSSLFCTTKTALNEDQYEESGRCCVLALPLPWPVGPTTTRKYVNGHPTNGFDDNMWYRDPGCAGQDCFFAKKVG